VGQDGVRGGRARSGRPGRPSLTARLVAAALLLLAAGAGITGVAAVLLARGYLIRQADRQLRAYADRLASHPFEATPFSGPVQIPGPVPIWGPASGGLGAGGPGRGGFAIEVRGSGGQLVMRAGAGTRQNPVIPVVPAGVTAHAGQPVTVAAGGGGGSWRVIAEPVHYRAKRILFDYSAEDFALFVTRTSRPGASGTLVVGLDLAGVGQTVGRLAMTGIAVGGVLTVAVGCLGAVLIGAVLRPVTQTPARQLEQTARAVAAGELACRVPVPPGGKAGRLALSLNTMLTQLEHGLTARAESEAAARSATEQMCRAIGDTGRRLRRPVSVIRGFAESYRPGGPTRAGDLDRMMRRVADEAASMDALVGELLAARQDRPPQRG
jgi:two-component system, OmpR family, sensor kinase